MKRKGWYLPMSLAVLLLCTAATEAPEPTTETYMKGGNYYIEKTYTLKNGEDIDHLLGASFELNGYTYHQIDVKSEPVVEVLTKRSISNSRNNCKLGKQWAGSSKSWGNQNV